MRLKSSAQHRSSVNVDGMEEIAEHFMRWIRKEFRGHKSEISPHQLVQRCKRFGIAYGIGKEDLIIDALMRRGFIEPSATDTYIIRYDLVRR